MQLTLHVTLADPREALSDTDVFEVSSARANCNPRHVGCREPDRWRAMADDDDARLPMVDDMAPGDPDYTPDDPWGYVYAGKAGIGDGMFLNSVLKEVRSMDEWIIDGGGTTGLDAGCGASSFKFQVACALFWSVSSHVRRRLCMPGCPLNILYGEHCTYLHHCMKRMSVLLLERIAVEATSLRPDSCMFTTDHNCAPMIRSHTRTRGICRPPSLERSKGQPFPFSKLQEQLWIKPGKDYILPAPVEPLRQLRLHEPHHLQNSKKADFGKTARKIPTSGKAEGRHRQRHTIQDDCNKEAEESQIPYKSSRPTYLRDGAREVLPRLISAELVQQQLQHSLEHGYAAARILAL